ncbi:MAG: hypothetical protein ACJ8G4_13780 [Burkholderiales bacterium]
MRARIHIGQVLFALYPLLIFAGLQFLDPRSVALLVLAALALRYRRHTLRILADFSVAQFVALGVAPLLGLAVLATNSEVLLRLYPAAISASMLILFGVTLVHPPSMVERFARMQQEELSPESVRYTRRVTLAWCAFFVLNGAIAAWTAIFASREAWALYNGFIAYLAMGTLFAGERLLRRRLLPAA